MHDRSFHYEEDSSMDAATAVITSDNVVQDEEDYETISTEESPEEPSVGKPAHDSVHITVGQMTFKLQERHLHVTAQCSQDYIMDNGSNGLEDDVLNQINGNAIPSTKDEQAKIFGGNGESPFTTVNGDADNLSPIEDQEDVRTHSNDSRDPIELVEKIDQADVVDSAKPFVKIPEVHDDEKFQGLLDYAKIRLTEETERTNDIHFERLVTREHCKELFETIQGARAAEILLSRKRTEMDILMKVIDQIKATWQAEEFDHKTYNMEHKMQHKKINLQHSIDQKIRVEEALKRLKVDSDRLEELVVKGNLTKKLLTEEKKKLDDLNEAYETANMIRQEAYEHFYRLMEHSYRKKQFFTDYNIDSEMIKAIALTNDSQGTADLCALQSEILMDLWNNQEGFRNDYVRCNLRRTISRFGTADGRSLGPNELLMEVPPINDYQETTPVERIYGMKKVITETDDETILSATPKISTCRCSSIVEDDLDATSRSYSSDLAIEEHDLSVEYEVSKAEEIMYEERAAALKEQCRLEVQVEEEEAMDIAQTEAAIIKAQKDAEKREKARKKRARRKNKSLYSEPSEEGRNVEKGKANANRKPLQVKEQGKNWSIPRPSSNSSKANMNKWIRLILALLLVLICFLSNSKVSLKTLLEKF